MIKFIGLDNYTREERSKIKELSEFHLKKILRNFSKSNLIIHAKKHNTTGNATKYSLHARVEAPTVLLNAKAADWDLKKVVHSILKKLEQEMQHKFRTDAQYKRAYEK